LAASPRLFPTKSSFFMLCVALLCVEFPFVFTIPSFDLSSSPNDRRDGYLADRHVDSHGPSGLRCASGKRRPHWLILGDRAAPHYPNTERCKATR
jgi:hypothetical protein